ncbi:hypothetical protein FMN50_14745 [Rhodobacterales bacterium]|nr:hypothetical protein FMN50_14745 [Rhodobacterales bacterium]
MTRRVSAIAVVVAIAVASFALAKGAGAQHRRSLVTETYDEDTLKRAFEAAESGNYEPLGALPEPSAADIPAIEPALSDESEVVRREAVALLARIGDPAAAPALAGALSDVSDDVATRAAAALYDLGGVAVEADPAVENQIRQAVDSGLVAGGAILMLAHSRDKSASAATLHGVREAKGGSLTEVFPSSPVVHVSLMADVALAGLGDGGAEAQLLASIGKADLVTLQFLLSVLREIDSPQIVRALATATLSDDRPVQGDAPSGAETGLRLADLAATRLARRYDLAVDIDDTADARLPDQTLDAVKTELERKLSE